MVVCVGQKSCNRHAHAEENLGTRLVKTNARFVTADKNWYSMLQLGEQEQALSSEFNVPCLFIYFYHNYVLLASGSPRATHKYKVSLITFGLPADRKLKLATSYT